MKIKASGGVKFGGKLSLKQTKPDWSSYSYYEDPTNSDSGYNDWYGHKVAVSADGYTVAISAPETDVVKSNAGRIFVYKWNGSAWNINHTFDGQNIGSRIGLNNLALNHDGTVIIFDEDDELNFYRYDSGNWVLYATKTDKYLSTDYAMSVDKIATYNYTTVKSKVFDVTPTSVTAEYTRATSRLQDGIVINKSGDRMASYYISNLSPYYVTTYLYGIVNGAWQFINYNSTKPTSVYGNNYQLNDLCIPSTTELLLGVSTEEEVWVYDIDTMQYSHKFTNPYGSSIDSFGTTLAADNFGNVYICHRGGLCVASKQQNGNYAVDLEHSKSFPVSATDSGVSSDGRVVVLGAGRQYGGARAGIFMANNFQ